MHLVLKTKQNSPCLHIALQQNPNFVWKWQQFEHLHQYIHILCMQAQNTCTPPTNANWARSTMNTKRKHTWASYKSICDSIAHVVNSNTLVSRTGIIQGNGSEEAADDSLIVCACVLAHLLLKNKYIILWVRWKWRGGNTWGVIVDPGWLIPSGSRRRLSAKAKQSHSWAAAA